MNTVSYKILSIFAAGWRHRYVIVLPILVLPVVGLFIGIMSEKKYSSHTTMLIQETAKMNPFLEDLAVSFMLKDRIDALISLLHSRHILGVVAKKRGLIDEDTSPEKHDEVIRELSNALSVSMAGKDLIRIDYKSSDPRDMKETLEVVSEQFIEQLLAPERSSLKGSSYFLEQHLQKRQKEVEDAEIALAEFQDQRSTELPELHASNVTHLSYLKQRLSEKEAELAGAVQSLGNLDQQLSKTNPVLGRLEEKIVQLRSELTLMRSRYTDKHSNVQGALRKLKSLEAERQSILANQDKDKSIEIDQLWALANNIPGSTDNSNQPLLVSQLENLQTSQGKVSGLREEISGLKATISKLETRMESYGANANELSKLERRLKVKRDLYDDLLLRQEKGRITQSLGVFEQESRVKVIDQPFQPTSTSNPPIIVFILGGLFGGLFLGCGIALVLELSDTSLRRQDRLEELTGSVVIARIPPMTDININNSGAMA